jgi:hypothetical protein
LIGAFAISITDIKDQVARHLNIGESTGGIDEQIMARRIDQPMAQDQRASVEA